MRDCIKFSRGEGKMKFTWFANYLTLFSVGFLAKELIRDSWLLLIPLAIIIANFMYHMIKLDAIMEVSEK